MKVTLYYTYTVRFNTSIPATVTCTSYERDAEIAEVQMILPIGSIVVEVPDAVIPDASEARATLEKAFLHKYAELSKKTDFIYGNLDKLPKEKSANL